jgi:hypothetical protein
LSQRVASSPEQARELWEGPRRRQEVETPVGRRPEDRLAWISGELVESHLDVVGSETRDIGTDNNHRAGAFGMRTLERIAKALGERRPLLRSVLDSFGQVGGSWRGDNHSASAAVPGLDRRPETALVEDQLQAAQTSGKEPPPGGFPCRAPGKDQESRFIGGSLHGFMS